MKSKIITAMLLLASCAFAQYGADPFESDPYGTDNTQQTAYGTPQTEYSTTRFNFEKEKNDLYTHTHRGFYFSTGLSFAYMNSTHTEKYGYEGYNNETNASGLLYSYEEIRIGGSIAGIASIYGLIGGGVGSGTFKSKSTRYYDENYSVDATLLKLQFGVGAEFYPIQEKENPMHGLFLGIAFGLAIDGAFYDYYDDDYYYGDYRYSGDEGYPYIFYRLEIGKDFWFSRRWSFGIAFNYTYGTYTDENSGYRYDDETDKCNGHTFGLTIRISH